jgi:hypothetical protein
MCRNASKSNLVKSTHLDASEAGRHPDKQHDELDDVLEDVGEREVREVRVLGGEVVPEEGVDGADLGCDIQ